MDATTQAKQSPPAAIAGPKYARGRSLACAVTSVVLGLCQGFGLYLVSSNLSSIQGEFGATASEALWLNAAYFATALSSAALLAKFRLQYGLRRFATLGLSLFFLVALLHLVSRSLESAIAVRAALGFVAAPVSTLAVLYMVEAFPKPLAPVGLLLGFVSLQIAQPLSRVISPGLLDAGRWQSLFSVDVALALLSWAAIHAVSLTPVPLRREFNRGDLVAFPLYAASLALFSTVALLGRTYWWTDTAWLGICLAGAIACAALYLIWELGRASPMLDLRWLGSPYMLRFMLAVVLFRIVLSHQNIGVVGLLTALGMANEQMYTLFLSCSAATVAGFVVAILIVARKGMYRLTILAAVLVSICAFADSHSTNLTRPEQFLLTQPMFSFAIAIFFAASCLFGFGPVVRDGNRQVVSFLAAFTFAQYMGSLIGTALIATAVVDTQQLHRQALATHAAVGHFGTGLRIAQLGGAVSGQVIDPQARSQRAMATFDQQVGREALVRAYNDVFQVIGYGAGGIALWMTWLGWRARQRRLAEATSTSGTKA